ncbi:MAG: aminofutalosine synthase MqnE, partial [Deltaproteobacteria bacterium]|nr:aminofutalosine synthase MqnE [Deltaproteobacteria bacterium]
MKQFPDAIEEKVNAGIRLSAEEGLYLLENPDFTLVGRLANTLRERLHGDVTYFNRNLHLNATNVCVAG